MICCENGSMAMATMVIKAPRAAILWIALAIVSELQ